MTRGTGFIRDKILVNVNQTSHSHLAAGALYIIGDLIELTARFLVANIQRFRTFNRFELLCLKGIKPNAFTKKASVYFNPRTDN